MILTHGVNDLFCVIWNVDNFYILYLWSFDSLELEYVLQIRNLEGKRTCSYFILDELVS